MSTEGTAFLRHTLLKLVKNGDDHTIRQVALMFSLVNGRGTVRGLAFDLRIDKAVVSRNLDRLEKIDGFIRREDDPDNGRSVFVSLTTKGKKYLDSMG